MNNPPSSLSSPTPPPPPNLTRRTRIVCISDTHNSTVKLPKGDVLVHAGDLTNQGSYSELSKSIRWLERADFEAKIVIAGNHDITLDHDFYSQHGQSFHNQNPQDPAKCLALLTSSPTITYLCHNSATIQLKDPKGPRTEFTVFGSPCSPKNGLWAFGYDQSAQSSEPTDTQAVTRSGAVAREIWGTIPLNIDILVTHTPPLNHCDESSVASDHLGCEELLTVLSRARPRLHICGHIHSGRGAERVRWKAGNPDRRGYVAYGEAAVERWEDPSPDSRSAKISLVDLTARGGNRPLDFHDLERVPGVSCSPSLLPAGTLHQGEVPTDRDGRDRDSGLSRTSKTGADLNGGLAIDTPSIIGDSLNPTRYDRTASVGGMGRRETCVVNCAVVATNWPHVRGKHLNKPIVVDLDLPVWV
ncbi:Metallo-dependent phosphatase-like protein [Podospora appendiculata]|uniref:Metallo-dependent phosphatase-like protein n=1 Tax=Podospora appendiculata TaxID=314037 RepID=A0AAE0X6H5_9PEZI|nr:Metallo-dependent phosphatase-like protein [Podospora appendiculata]